MTTIERKIIGLAHLEAMKYLDERMKNGIGRPNAEMKAEAKKIYDAELAKLKKQYNIADEE